MGVVIGVVVVETAGGKVVLKVAEGAVVDDETIDDVVARADSIELSIWS